MKNIELLSGGNKEVVFGGRWMINFIHFLFGIFYVLIFFVVFSFFVNPVLADWAPDISSFTDSGSTLDLTSYGRGAQALSFSDDGLKIFIGAGYGYYSLPVILTYSLCRPYEVSCGTFLRSTDFSSYYGSGVPTGLYWTDSGNYFYISDMNGSTDRHTREFHCSVPYDTDNATLISTMSGIVYLKSFSFNSDGSKMFSIEQQGFSPYYVGLSVRDLSVDYDITSASAPIFYLYDPDLYYWSKAYITNDGLNIYIFGFGQVTNFRHYILSAPWDFTTISATSDNLTLSSYLQNFPGQTQATSFLFRPDLKNFYLATDYVNNKIYQFETLEAPPAPVCTHHFPYSYISPNTIQLGSSGNDLNFSFVQRCYSNNIDCIFGFGIGSNYDAYGSTTKSNVDILLLNGSSIIGGSSLAGYQMANQNVGLLSVANDLIFSPGQSISFRNVQVINPIWPVLGYCSSTIFQVEFTLIGTKTISSSSLPDFISTSTQPFSVSHILDWCYPPKLCSYFTSSTPIFGNFNLLGVPLIYPNAVGIYEFSHCIFDHSACFLIAPDKNVYTGLMQSFQGYRSIFPFSFFGSYSSLYGQNVSTTTASTTMLLSYSLPPFDKHPIDFMALSHPVYFLVLLGYSRRFLSDILYLAFIIFMFSYLFGVVGGGADDIANSSGAMNQTLVDQVNKARGFTEYQNKYGKWSYRKDKF